MRVREIMSESPGTCSPNASLREVALKMVDCDCGMIPVVDGEGKAIGTITDRDITCRAVAEGKNPLDLTAGDIMTTPCLTVSPDSDINECEDKLEQNQIRRMVVADDNGRCCGILSQADIARHRAPEEAAELLREVSQPSDSASHIH